VLRQALSPELVPIVAATFAERVAGEREARARFGRLGVELEAIGAERSVIDMALRSAKDEDRHARQFAAWAADLGRVTDPDAPFVAPRVGSATQSERERVLLEVVALSCLAETVATAVLGAALDAVEVPMVKDGLHSILRDEVQHSKLGWAHLAIERKRGHGGDLGARLPALLEAGIPSERVEDGVWPLAPELGLLPKAQLFQLLSEVLRLVVLPGFELHDVDTGPARAWLEKRGFAGTLG
jgi:hypothetical protein